MSEPRPWWRNSEILPSVLAYAGAAIAFLIGLQQYQEDQRWRRLEFITERLSEYEAHPEVRLARLMLEYPSPTICLFGGEPGEAEAGCTRITDSLLVSALRMAGTAPERLNLLRPLLRAAGNPALREGTGCGRCEVRRAGDPSFGAMPGGCVVRCV